MLDSDERRAWESLAPLLVPALDNAPSPEAAWLNFHRLTIASSDRKRLFRYLTD